MEQVIRIPQDLTYLAFDGGNAHKSSGTGGSFLKAHWDYPEGRIYYKLSCYDYINGVTGHESVNEIIVDRLLNILDIPHVHYQLILGDILVDQKPLRTWLCASHNFRRRGEEKMPLDGFYDANRLAEESRLDFCIRQGWSEYIYQMLVVDYLILNRDRHGANIEVLQNRQTKDFRLAPLFDHGVSLFCRTPDEAALAREDVLADKPVQCFVGSRSARDNLKLIPSDGFPHLRPLEVTHKAVLLEGLEEALSRIWLDRIWEMIWRRWQCYEDFRYKK